MAGVQAEDRLPGKTGRKGVGKARFAPFITTHVLETHKDTRIQYSITIENFEEG